MPVDRQRCAQVGNVRATMVGDCLEHRCMLIPRTDPRRGRVMLRGELLDAGYTDKAIARLVAAGTWVKIRHGAYVDAGQWSLLDAAGRHTLTARAVVLQARTPVAVSHVSALPFHGGPTWALSLEHVHVTRLDGRAGRAEAGVNQHSGAVDEGDVVEVDGLPILSPTRTALDVTTVAPTEPSLAVVNHLLHVGATTIEELAERYARMAHWPWTLGTDVALRLADARIESVGESRTYYMCFLQGLPMPVPQHEIRDPSGRVIARVDFAWPDLGVFLEFDGKVKYEKLLAPGQRASDVVVAEKRREELICRLTGWRCIRITWADLERPERTAALIRAALFPTVRSA
jgi:hypothetical protein